MGNDRGAGPAEPSPPDYPANKIERQFEDHSATPARRDWAVAAELAQRRDRSDESEPVEDGDGAEIEIETDFGRRLAGVRRLPWRERAAARRAAREWRLGALKALREKRATARHARFTLRRLKAAAHG
jgi:hypothetical protein